MNADQAKRQLLEELDSLQELRSKSKDARAPVELDQQSVGRLSRMDALQKQNMDMATEQRRLIRIKVIEAALGRIESGEFGYCVMCDEAIAPPRLNFDPAIASCVSCSR